MRSRNRDAVMSVFERLRQSFPHLHTDMNESPAQVEVELVFPVQQGLLFDLELNLQNGDELHLFAGALWADWYPIAMPDRAEAAFEAVSGLLSGDWRILQQWRGEALARAQLQKPVGNEWEVVYTSAPFPPLLPWPRKTISIVQNSGSS